MKSKFTAWLIILESICVFSFPSSALFSVQGISTKATSQIRVSHLKLSSTDNNIQSAREEAEELLNKARKLRESLSSTTTKDPSTDLENEGPTMASTTSVENQTKDSTIASYRLYLDIGREPGTWMDPRWGMSGTRVEFNLDMAFLDSIATEDQKKKMVKDNFGGKSSEIRSMECLSEKGARLRRGFDSMKCYDGAYRLDFDKSSNNVVVRFFVDVEGLGETSDSNYGDITISKGCLYFSIPCFGNSVRNLSLKEGPVTVRQMGWHTGWRREESRIVGIFKAVPLEKAKLKDGF